MRIDVKWHVLSTKYRAVAFIMLGILVIPHSNADSERVFSAVRRCQTDFRSNMQTHLLESLIVTKTDLTSRGSCCHQEKFSPDFLLKAKRATKTGLSQGSQSSQSSQEEESDTETVQSDMSGRVLGLLSNAE